MVIAASVCLAAILGGANQTPPAAAAPEKEAREAVAQFYTALNAMFTGDMKPMNDVWSHAADVTYMGPAGGYQIGWKNVGEELGRQAAMKLGGKIEPSDIHVIAIGGALAIVSNYEKGENLDATGKKNSGFNPRHHNVSLRRRQMENDRPSHGFVTVARQVNCD